MLKTKTFQNIQVTSSKIREQSSYFLLLINSTIVVIINYLIAIYSFIHNHYNRVHSKMNFHTKSHKLSIRFSNQLASISGIPLANQGLRCSIACLMQETNSGSLFLHCLIYGAEKEIFYKID